MKSFIRTPALQHNSGRSQVAVPGLIALVLVAAGAGYWFGHNSTDRPTQTDVSPPLSIVDASARFNDQPSLGSAVGSAQVTKTVGKLHADILTLRMLYRRLAEDAGVDLSDFELEDVMAPPTLTEPVDESLEKLSEQLEMIKESSSALGDWYQLRSRERAFSLTGPVVMNGQMSSVFGWRTAPSSGQTKLHRGVDYSGHIGEPVLALADGVVSFQGKVHAYGNMVELVHADGLRTRYAHNDSNTVALGQWVEQGQIIARLGSTGRSTGPHVHLEVHLNGEIVDPMLYIQ